MNLKLNEIEELSLIEMKHNSGYKVLFAKLQEEKSRLEKILYSNPKISENVKDDMRYKLGELSSLLFIERLMTVTQKR